MSETKPTHIPNNYGNYKLQISCQKPEILKMATENSTISNERDVLSEPHGGPRRCRIEWPYLSPNFLETIQITQLKVADPNPSVQAEAIHILDSEATKCDPDSGAPGEGGIFDNWHHPRFPKHDNLRIAKVLTALYWRGRVQSTLLDIFVMLNHRGFIHLDTLRTPISHMKLSQATRTVSLLLKSFEGVAKEQHYDMGPHPLWEVYSTNKAVEWLATMIVRGSADIPLVFDHIEKSGYLGSVNNDKLKSFG